MTGPAFAAIAQKYPKAVCHLNQAQTDKKLGVILGAGVSDELGLPKWDALLASLERKLRYPTGKKFPPSYRAEQLFQLYRQRSSAKFGNLDRYKQDAAVIAGWRSVVRSTLYAEYTKRNGKSDGAGYCRAIKQHPYLCQLARLTSSLQLVVSHNFDDALEVAIELNSKAARPARLYHSFWKPEPFLRKGMVNIYHPNGFTPFGTDSKGSDNIILTEGSFADYLANTNTAETSFLLRHLADKTTLILGHSLSDGTLKNALRLHATQRPGHVNYYVHWLPEGSSDLSDEQRDAISAANFNTYNLVTLFATSKEVGHLLDAINTTDDELEGAFEHLNLQTRYVYYISGAVSSGKSTILGHLRDMITVEEWPSKMPPAMTRPSTTLNVQTEKQIDERLEEAIWIKNQEIDRTKVGIVAVDRAPLDFVAFPGPKNEPISEITRKRTASVLKRLRKDNFARLCAGHVIVVSAKEEVLVERQLLRGRISAEEVSDHVTYLREQQSRMIKAYIEAGGVGSIVYTDPCSIAVSVRDVARIIHFGEYKPFDFAGRLRALSTEKIKNAP